MKKIQIIQRGCFKRLWPTSDLISKMFSKGIFKQILLILVILQSFNDGACMFEWLFGKKNADSSETGDEKEPMTRFEVLSADEKFLDFATTLVDLSPLDACYNVVVYQLKKKCGELSEEELGKLSVKLLNCQSEVEQRPVYACDPEMTLAQCTKSMDSVTWNTYQIVGNRARAMCYAIQQLQFRRLTERSVNMLAEATTAQMKSMQELKVVQDHLHTMATDTVRRLFENQQELLVTHKALQAGQDDVFTSVANNVKQLQQEKELIAAGNLQLAQLAEKIRSDLNMTANLIKSQGTLQHKKHEDVLKDLKLIHNKASEALIRLDESSKQLLSHHDSLQKQQDEVFQNLYKINTTVTNVMITVLGLQSQMEQRITWVTQILGGADDKLEVLQCCVLHLAYFLLVAMVAAFLHTTVLTRLILMVVLVSNMAGQLAHRSSLDFAGLTVFMAAIVMGQWLLRQIRVITQRRRRDSTASSPSALMFSSDSSDESPLSEAEVRQLTVLLQRLSHTVLESLGTERLLNGSIPRSPSTTTTPSPRPANIPPCPQPGPSGDVGQNLAAVRQRLLNTVVNEGRMSSRSSRASTPSFSRMSRGSTPSVSSRCLGHTLAGGQCRLSATPGSDYCRLHVNNS